MQNLNHLALFVEIAEAGSLSSVAKKKGVSAAALSKQIASLEQRLKISLFHRSHRRMTLTEIGEDYLKRCRTILEAVENANDIISQAHTEPRGMLKIVSGRYFAERFIIPYLAEFQNLYPKVMIDIEVAERTPDLKGENIDIAFGMSNAWSQDLICRKVAISRHVLCASPAYLNEYGIPQAPHELVQHKYITHNLRSAGNVLKFSDKQEVVLKPILQFNDARSMLQAALHGAGIISLNHYILEEAIDNGQLIPVLEAYANSPRPVYLFYRKNRYVEPKLRSFIDFILKKMR